MTEPQFYNFRSPKSSAHLAKWADEVDLETVICPKHKGHQRGGKRITPLSVVLPGDRTRDILWTWYSECLITDYVLKLFKKSRFTGYEVKPVKARYKNTNKKPPRLWELIVTGWAGIAPPESGIRVSEHCDACGDTVYSDCTNPKRLVSASQWDGSDLFMVWPLPRFIFITERVTDVLKENELTEYVLIPSDKMPCGKDGFSPGRLSYFMPEKRARELGEASGIY